MINPIEAYADNVIDFHNEEPDTHLDNKSWLNYVGNIYKDTHLDKSWWYHIKRNIYKDPKCLDINDCTFSDIWADYVVNLLAVDYTLSDDRIVDLCNKFKTVSTTQTPKLLYRHGFRDFSRFDVNIPALEEYTTTLLSLITEMNDDDNIDFTIIENFHKYFNKGKLDNTYYNKLVYLFGYLEISNPIIKVPDDIEISKDSFIVLTKLPFDTFVNNYKHLALRNETLAKRFLREYGKSIPEIDNMFPKAYIYLYMNKPKCITKEMFDELKDKRTFLFKYTNRFLCSHGIPDFMITDETQDLIDDDD